MTPLLLIFTIVLMPLTAQADTIHVYLQGGQSNSDGRADPSGLPTSPRNLQRPQADVEFFFDGSLTTLRPGSNISELYLFGPEITFGRDMADYFSDIPNTSIAIIKYAKGGTNLHTEWKAGGDATTTNDGIQYINFQNTVNAGLAAIAAAHPSDTIIISGMIWHQGETDAVHGATTAAAYKENLTNFIADIRSTYGADLPFIIGEIATGGKNFTTVREAQAAVAAADPFAGFVDTEGFELSDSVHFNASGQMKLGSGFALEMQVFTMILQTSTADCYIRESSPTTNYGSSSVMIANNNFTRFSFMRFDISAFEVITGAKLELETILPSMGQNYEIFGLLEDDDDWEEDSLTWNNSTNLSGSKIDTKDVHTGTSMGTFADNGKREIFPAFDVNSGNIINFLNADDDGIVTFVISETGAVDTGGTGWATREHSKALAPTLSVFGTFVDTTAPNPDPMTFSGPPSTVGNSSIAMSATIATDPNSVEYFFESVTGNGNDSGWQDSELYIDTGLIPDTAYSYRVRARDKSKAQNMTAYSPPASAKTANEGLTTTSLIPTQDTYIRDSSATTIFGADDAMVANENGNSVRMAVFSFDLSSLPTGLLASIKLELDYVIGISKQNYEIWGLLDAYEVFDESTLTWDTASFVSSGSIDATKAYGGVALGTFSNTSTSINIAFNETSGTFVDFVDASSNNTLTFVIIDPDDGAPGTGWATKEHGNALAPTLTVTTIPIP